MKFHERIKALHEEIDDVIDAWYQTTRKELNMVDLPPSLLTHLMEPSKAVKVRPEQQVVPGYYTSLDGSVKVNVLSQDLSSGLIVFEMSTSAAVQPDEQYQTMSPGIFYSLFKQNDSGTIPKAQMLEIYQNAETFSTATQKQHLKDRAESFTWGSIAAAHGKMAERYTDLYTSLVHEDREVVTSDYLEFLFLAFILGARLGFSPRCDFHALYSGVFELTDNTLERCQATMKYYEDQLVETTFEEFKLYDPVLEWAPPVSHFVVMSTKDQVGLNNTHYPKGCFMPSQSVVSKLLPRP